MKKILLFFALLVSIHTFAQQNNNKEAKEIRICCSSDTTNKPLYVIDGKEVSQDTLNAINPKDIEHINILKDSSAVNEYGERAKYGVVEIYLKKKK
jgi:hypothetical protein